MTYEYSSFFEGVAIFSVMGMFVGFYVGHLFKVYSVALACKGVGRRFLGGGIFVVSSMSLLVLLYDFFGANDFVLMRCVCFFLLFLYTLFSYFNLSKVR